MFKHLFLFTYGLILSAVCGTLVGLFYILQGQLIELIWRDSYFQPLRNAVIMIAVALVILITRRWFGQLPKNFSNIMVEIRRTGTANYRYVLLQMIIPAIILVSGTSLGPEATLVSSTVLYWVWLNDKLRYLTVNFNVFMQQSLLKRVIILLTPHHYLQPRTNEHHQLISKPLTITYLANGILWLAIVFIVFHEPSLIIRLGTSYWHFQALNWFIPLLIGSYLLGHIYLKMMIQLRHVIQGRLFHEFSLVIFGGLMIYLVSLWAPDLLFSGQHNFHLFTAAWQHQSFWYLAIMSFGKLILLTICLNTGWIGGDIFPVLFASTAQGLAISNLIPGLDHLYVAVVVATGLSSAILEAPLLVGCLMGIMFAPVNLIAVVAVATIMLMEVRAVEKRHTTYIPTVFDQMEQQ